MVKTGSEVLYIIKENDLININKNLDQKFNREIQSKFLI